MEAAQATNGFDQAVVRDLVGQIEDKLMELLSERGSYMARCKVIREHISGIYEDAKGKGIPKNVLRTVIATRELDRKIERRIADLEDDGRQLYEIIEEALGDYGSTPLGAATINRARPATPASTESSGLDALAQ